MNYFRVNENKISSNIKNCLETNSEIEVAYIKMLAQTRIIDIV